MKRAGRPVVTLLVSVAMAVAAEPTPSPPTAVPIIADPLARVGLPLRVRIGGPGSTAIPPDCAFVAVALLDGDRVCAASEIAADAAQVAAGITAVLVPAEPALAPRIALRLTDADHRARWRRTVGGIDSPAGLREDLAAVHTRLTATPDPLPRLWLEQAGELLAASTPTIVDALTARDLLTRLAAVTPGVPTAATVTGTTTILLAGIDPIDGSVQPVRLTLPPATSSVLASASPPLVLLARPRAATKARWASPPDSWLVAAATAGVAVAEVFPGGDAAFRGAGRQRLALSETVARVAHPGLGPTRVVFAGDDVDLADPAAWHLPHPLPSEPPVTRLAAWARGPFVVVVGTGEHAAAVGDNRALAAAFASAWAAHAQGLAPQVDDTAFRPGDWPGRNLVLIGSPRSNAVAGPWAARFPVVWDDRTVRLGDRLCHRSRLPGIAVAIPHPDEPARTVLLLDGSPAWTAARGEQPLLAEAADADVLVLPGDPAEGEPLRLRLGPGLLLEARPTGP